MLTTRFAPSPNGDLHLGHALSALTGFALARRAAGRFLVRIEDIDLTRVREEHVTQILDDLAWLGLRWEEPVLRQSRHFADYEKAAARLRELGVLYPCPATRGEINSAVARLTAEQGGWPSDPDGAPIYPGIARGVGGAAAADRVAGGEPFAWRLDMSRALDAARAIAGSRSLTFVEVDDGGRECVVAAEPERWGDAVIVRKDIPASYHLAVVVDDARQGVSLVTRGMDLRPATGLHRLLQVLLALPEPRYHHHRLILGADGRKLSKSEGATSIKSLRAAGVSASEIRHRIGVA